MLFYVNLLDFSIYLVEPSTSLKKYILLIYVIVVNVGILQGYIVCIDYQRHLLHNHFVRNSVGTSWGNKEYVLIAAGIN